mmetsp:Transcript_48126/g.111445  ORF Transcript_48126/g.111445 Transcript_48126/m.111445 type:complete len:584 (+) Transcript_48126:68-1819(+)
MADPDISEGSRELVDITADAVEGMGTHLAQIADIIAQSVMPPKKGERGAAKRCIDKLELYKAFCVDITRRRKEAEGKMEKDLARLREWRKEAGTEGASMIEEMEMLFNKVRAQKKMLESEYQRSANEREKVRMLLQLGDKQKRKMAALAEAYIRRIRVARAETMKRAGVCSWMQCSFDNIRFRFKSAQEAQKLKIQYLQKLRKARAQSRLDCIRRTREQRLLQSCVLAVQEELVERRQEQYLREIRHRYQDHVLILEAQVAQALGDEEKAKDLINEQVRRLEEAKERAKKAERQMKVAQREAREAKADAERARLEAEEARRLQAEAEAREQAAQADARAARNEAAEAHSRADASDAARLKAEKGLRKAEDELRKKARKINSLQRMLVELGAESDSDMPPDERPPAFFINEDGSKAPRPRTRKERMAMAYREAESARWELRLGMAAMIDKDIANAQHIERLRSELDIYKLEVIEVRNANESLAADVEAAAVVLADSATQTLEPIPDLPLAPSTAAASPYSSHRPVFQAAPLVSSPRFLKKTASQPIFMPPLGGPQSELRPPEKIALAPLRKLKRPTSDWRVNWH